MSFNSLKLFFLTYALIMIIAWVIHFSITGELFRDNQVKNLKDFEKTLGN